MALNTHTTIESRVLIPKGGGCTNAYVFNAYFNCNIEYRSLLSHKSIIDRFMRLETLHSIRKCCRANWKENLSTTSPANSLLFSSIFFESQFSQSQFSSQVSHSFKKSIECIFLRLWTCISVFKLKLNFFLVTSFTLTLDCKIRRSSTVDVDYIIQSITFTYEKLSLIAFWIIPLTAPQLYAICLCIWLTWTPITICSNVLAAMNPVILTASQFCGADPITTIGV